MNKVMMIVFTLIGVCFCDTVTIEVAEVTVQYFGSSGNNISMVGSNDINYMFYFGEDSNKRDIAKMIQAQLLFAKANKLPVKLEYDATNAGSIIKTVRVDPRW